MCGSFLNFLDTLQSLQKNLIIQLHDSTRAAKVCTIMHFSKNAARITDFHAKHAAELAWFHNPAFWWHKPGRVPPLNASYWFKKLTLLPVNVQLAERGEEPFTSLDNLIGLDPEPVE